MAGNVDPATWAALLLRPPTAAGQAGATTAPYAGLLLGRKPRDLADAAVAYLGARPELAAAFGAAAWIWQSKAPRRAAYPLAVLTTTTIGEDWQSADDGGGTPYTEHLQVETAVYAPAEDLARSLARLVATALDDAPLEFTSGLLLVCRRAVGSIGLDADPGPGGADVWQAVVRFECEVARYE